MLARLPAGCFVDLFVCFTSSLVLGGGVYAGCRAINAVFYRETVLHLVLVCIVSDCLQSLPKVAIGNNGRRHHDTRGGGLRLVRYYFFLSLGDAFLPGGGADAGCWGSLARNICWYWNNNS